MLGVFWSLLNPLLMLAVYSFVFGSVFSAKWAGAGASNSSFALLMFVGLLVHGLFAECLMKSTNLIVSNSNYVKKVIFPLEVLATTVIVSSLFHFFAGLVMLILLQFFMFGLPGWSILWLPIILAPYVIGLLGLSWFISALGVFFRDLSQLAGTLSSIMLFLSPVFYSRETIPEPYRHYMDLNPLTPIIEQSREVIVYGNAPDLFALLPVTGVFIVVYLVGFWFFSRTRKGFSDVL